MKKRSLFITFAVVIVAATVAFVSCKKEQAPIVPNQDKSTLARIKDFKRQLEAVELNPDSRTVTYMSIPHFISTYKSNTSGCTHTFQFGV